MYLELRCRVRRRNIVLRISGKKKINLPTGKQQKKRIENKRTCDKEIEDE